MVTKTEPDAAGNASGLGGTLDTVELIQRTAHDFKNPLSIVMGCGDLIAWMAEDGGHTKIKDLADDVVNAAIRLKGFTDTMVAVTRLERGDTPALQVVGMRAALRTITSEFVRASRRARIELTVVEGEELDVSADPDWLSRVLFNLVDHALRYAPSGTAIRATVASTGKGHGRLAISDDGPMVVNKTEIFSSADHKTQERQSSGLGLTYCAMAIRAMHGSIGVDDVTPGAGACFWLELPLA